MLNKIGKIKINKLVRKDINYLIREVAIDLINYLSNYGFDINTLVDKINTTEFIIFNSKNLINSICYKVDNREKNIIVDFTNYEGLFLPIVDSNSKGDLKLYKKVCAIKTNSVIGTENPYFKQKIIHELLHLLSGSEEVEEESKYYSGFLKIEYYQKNSKSYKKIQNGSLEFNEAVTELLADNIYRELYDKNFYMICTEDKDGIRPCVNCYYYNKMLVKVLNLFAYGTNDTTHLLLAYMTNDINSYLTHLKININMSLYYLNNIMAMTQVQMQKYIDKKYYSSIAYLKDTFMQVLVLALTTLKQSYDEINLPKEDIEKWKKYFSDNMELICYYPIFNTMKDEIKSILDSIL